MPYPLTRSALAGALLLGACAPATPTALPRPGAEPPALEAISRADLRRDLFALAGDSMRGRRAGELDELRASVWLAERAREAGLEPAGDDGTYFQFFPVHRLRLAPASSATVGGAPLRLWQDAIPLNFVPARVDAPVVLADAGSTSLQGRVVVAQLRLPSRVPRRDVSFWAWRTANAAFREQFAALRDRRPEAVLLVADSVGMQAWEIFHHFLADGQYLTEDPSAQPASAPAIPILLVRPEAAERLGLMREGERVRLDLETDHFVAPSVNVVARAPGTDPALRHEHVLYSSHQDHDGVGTPVAGDSIWNGADDNATVSVALLAIGRAFREQPGRRSALFVWHGGEERGLLGSRWHAERPVIPRENIVAVLNADMIGRNHPDSAALLGATGPHRNSPELVEMALEANRRVAGFTLDSTWDDPSHPEGWYFRSDHLPYARAGVPAIFFTTLLHPDYHTPRDEPDRIDLDKLTRMTRWMYAAGWLVANAERRPALDPNFQLER